MSSLSDKFPIQVTIPKVESNEKITQYFIIIELMPYRWEVLHRYSEFADLHESLVADHGVAKDIIPPKKIIGNKDPVFIEKRRKDLEKYLQTIVDFMSSAIPDQLAEFLDLKYYEVNFLLQDLSKLMMKNEEEILFQNQLQLNPLELMAISKQMQRPNHLIYSSGKGFDFTNIVDICSSIKKLTILGSSDTYRSSNIIMNELLFHLKVFKSLTELSIENSSVSNIQELGPVRQTVKILKVQRCKVTNMSDVICCDSIHRDVILNGVEHAWTALESLDLSNNFITAIDKSLTLTRNLTYLNLSCNRISSVGNYLTKLPHLLHLDLSGNQLNALDDLHTKFGNITRLDISRNNLADLSGLAKLYSVVSLNLSSNRIETISDVEVVCNLPCLDELSLTGNPVTTSIDYRVKVLELFGKRANEVCLDNERPTQKELDKVAILQALRTAREGKLPVMTLSRPPPSSLSLSLEKTDVGAIAKE